MSSKQENKNIQKSNYILWVDILKGVGIILVVIAHINSPKNIISEFIYLFHMPLFFLIGGYLHKPTSTYIDFFKRKAKHLLIPYFVFLVTILIVHHLIIGQHFSAKDLVKYLYGGAVLSGWFGVFWFTTCFFITQQLFNFIITRFRTKGTLIIALALLIASYINSFFFSEVSFPWTFNVSFYALSFYLGGYYLKKYDLIKHVINNQIIIIILLIITVTSFSYLKPYVFVDMKYSNYGIPFYSLICAFIMIIFNITVAVGLGHYTILYLTLRKIGSASMVIMYLHQPIQLILNDYVSTSGICRFIFAIILPTIVYQLMKKNKIISQFCLGEVMTTKLK